MVVKMSGYIKAIRFPGTGKGNAVELAYPINNSENTINVFAGPNNTGKSYFLQRIRSILCGEWLNGKPLREQEIILEFSTKINDRPKTLFLGKTWNLKEGAGVINVEKENLRPPADIPSFKEAALYFIYRHLNEHSKQIKNLSIAQWMSNAKVRQEILGELENEFTIYRCDADDDIVKKIRNILEGDLYFRQAKVGKIEFVLRHSDDTSIPYPQWSDGQKVIFYFLLLFEYYKPNVVLLDEIENHLHPKLITHILRLLKQAVPQTLISTHHPHVIFSELVDKVFYIENAPTKTSDALPVSDRYNKIQFKGAPTRIIVPIEDSFEKITKTYRLFDHQDLQLLKQATRINSDAEIIFYRALMEIFHCGTVGTRKDMIPDRQTLALANAIKSHSKLYNDIEKEIKILDFGAGVGRQAGELSKMTTWQLGCKVDWLCWEPKKENREKLENNLKTYPSTSVKIVTKLNDVPNQTCNFCLLANVLHEVTPEDFADLIYYASSKLIPDEGVMVIMELYPLLRAEKYAVPYSSTNMKKILNGVGFQCSESLFPVHDSTAYCVYARLSNGSNIQREELLRFINMVWDEIEEEVSKSYAYARAIGNYDDYRNVIQNLTTLASITAFRKKIWT